MSAIALDTLKLARSLREKAKLSPDQAEGFADAIAEAMQGDLATKSDIEGVRREIEGVRREIEGVRGEIDGVRGDLNRVDASLRTELRGAKGELEARVREAELRLEKQIEASKAEILKWMFGTIGLQTVAIIGAVLAVARIVRP